jgi:nucleotide-binding universal stress UspA family protein
MSKIVVGVDGSTSSLRALQWASTEARLRGAKLEVVHAWPHPSAGAFYGFGMVDEENLVPELRRAAHDVVDKVLQAADLQGVDVETKTVEGPAQRALVNAARDAEMLVVGSRGRDGLAGVLLGSVSHYCANHADCPTVIIHAANGNSHRDPEQPP